MMKCIRHIIRKNNIYSIHNTYFSTEIKYVSDLHSELNGPLSINDSGKVLLLGGDIGHPFNSDYKKLLEKISKSFSLTYIVSGNHEYHTPINFIEMKEIDNEISKICNELGNVHFLQNSTKKITNNLNIFGATMWTRVPSAYPLSVDNIKIQHNNKQLTNDKITEMNNTSIQKLQEEMEKCKQENKKLLVLTHHPPSFLMQDEKFKNYRYNMRFYNDLDSLFCDPVIGWVCGHTHVRMVKSINGIPCRINAYGYKHEHSNHPVYPHTFTLDC